MFLLEYQARESFLKYGIPVMKAAVVKDISELEDAVADLRYPLVVKAQVQTGGRGKAGGIKFASDKNELKKCSAEILGMKMREFNVDRIMISEKADVISEFYLSVILDRAARRPVVIFSSQGGMDIEETAAVNPEAVIKLSIDPAMGYKYFHTLYIAGKSGLEIGLAEKLHKIMASVYELFMKSDSLLVEINPLALCSDNEFRAIDGKMNIDDSALYRQTAVKAYRDALTEHKLVLEAREFGFLYIPVADEGSVGIISNGSGMLMSTMDLISGIGMSTRAGLDLGGGATAERIKEAVRIMFADSGIKYLFINIFGGITRCNEVAKGIQDAMTVPEEDRKIFVRLEGTNKDKGLEILESSGKYVISVEGLVDGVRKLDEYRRSI